MFRLEKKFLSRDPPPRNSKDLLWLRGGRYASCVHAGGLSCQPSFLCSHFRFPVHPLIFLRPPVREGQGHHTHLEVAVQSRLSSTADFTGVTVYLQKNSFQIQLYFWLTFWWNVAVCFTMSQWHLNDNKENFRKITPVLLKCNHISSKQCTNVQSNFRPFSLSNFKTRSNVSQLYNVDLKLTQTSSFLTVLL